MTFDWTEGRVKRLKELRDDGLSASQIASQIGGVSRNAVIGKLLRLGLHTKVGRGGQPKARSRDPGLGAVSRPRRSVASLEISFLDLQPDQCRYATNDAPFVFCGQPVVRGTSWCAECAEIVFGMPLSEEERERRRQWGKQIGRRNVASITGFA